MRFGFACKKSDQALCRWLLWHRRRTVQAYKLQGVPCCVHCQGLAPIANIAHAQADYKAVDFTGQQRWLGRGLNFKHLGAWLPKGLLFTEWMMGMNTAKTIQADASLAQLHVIMSGGFAGAYQQVVAAFETRSGIKVFTASGASQGKGAQTIASLLNNGERADMVILSREGLSELIALGYIVCGSDVDLARVALGAGVRSGAAKPDISSMAALKQTLLQAQTIAVPASTSGIYLKEQVFPRLGIDNLITVKVKERGTQSAALVAQGEANMALQPVSELVGAAGIDYVGRLPQAVQLVQVFAAAITKRAGNAEAAKQLIAFLASPRTASAKIQSGMEVVLSPCTQS